MRVSISFLLLILCDFGETILVKNLPFLQFSHLKPGKGVPLGLRV